MNFLRSLVFTILSVSVISIVIFSSCAKDLIVFTNITKEEEITNYIGVSSNELGIYIYSHEDADTVHPTFKMWGSIYMKDFGSFAGFTVEITQTGYKKDITIYNTSNWTVTIFTQYISYMHLVFTLSDTNGNTFVKAINLFVENRPVIEIATDYLVTNAEVISISGTGWIVSPASITSVVLQNISGTNTDNYVAMVSLTTGWTDTINAINWNVSSLTLYPGYNYITISCLATNTIYTQAITNMVVLRSLFKIDGERDSGWDSAPLLGRSTNAGFGNNWLDDLRITNDNVYLYIWVGNNNITNLGYNGVRIAIAIDTNNSVTGCSNDSWAGSFYFSPTDNALPDIEIQFRVQYSNQVNGAGVYTTISTDGGISWIWTNVANTWDASMQKNCLWGVNISSGYGWEMAIPLQLLGLTSGITLHPVVVLSGNQNIHGAWDIIPEHPSNEISTFENQSTIPNAIRIFASNYVVF